MYFVYVLQLSSTMLVAVLLYHYMYLLYIIFYSILVYCIIAYGISQLIACKSFKRFLRFVYVFHRFVIA